MNIVFLEMQLQFKCHINLIWLYVTESMVPSTVFNAFPLMKCSRLRMSIVSYSRQVDLLSKGITQFKILYDELSLFYYIWAAALFTDVINFFSAPRRFVTFLILPQGYRIFTRSFHSKCYIDFEQYFHLCVVSIFLNNKFLSIRRRV